MLTYEYFRSDLRDVSLGLIIILQKVKKGISSTRHFVNSHKQCETKEKSTYRKVIFRFRHLNQNIIYRHCGNK